MPRCIALAGSGLVLHTCNRIIFIRYCLLCAMVITLYKYSFAHLVLLHHAGSPTDRQTEQNRTRQTHRQTHRQTDRVHISVNVGTVKGGTLIEEVHHRQTSVLGLTLPHPALFTTGKGRRSRGWPLCGMCRPPWGTREASLGQTT